MVPTTRSLVSLSRNLDFYCSSLCLKRVLSTGTSRGNLQGRNLPPKESYLQWTSPSDSWQLGFLAIGFMDIRIPSHSDPDHSEFLAIRDPGHPGYLAVQDIWPFRIPGHPGCLAVFGISGNPVSGR